MQDKNDSPLASSYPSSPSVSIKREQHSSSTPDLTYINPETGKPIKYDGPTFRDLKNEESNLYPEIY